MDANNLEKLIQSMVVKLVEMASDLIWNTISDNCQFILTEIKNSEENFYIQRRFRNKEKKKSSTLIGNT